MPESTDPTLAPSLSKRFDHYCQLVEDLVLRGIEQPSCELKRAVAIDKSDLAGRLDFVKFVQGMANSHTEVECLIVIGADQKEKKFFNVDNADDFDPAKLSATLARYLQPEPRYEVFNNMRASTGERYVLIVLNPVQPRPIMIQTEGASGGKTHFRPGDIWIKHNTSSRAATKADLDLMYAPQIEEEAAKRARLLFEHLKEQLGPGLLSQAVTATPVPELLMGSRERLARFAEAMIASGERTRFTMLLEMARRTVIEKWEPYLERTEYPHAISDQEKTEVLDYYRDEYRPTVESVVDLGINLIRYDGGLDWFAPVIVLLVDAFTVSCKIGHLRAMDDKGEDTLPFSRPAFEIYIGMRTLATYAIARQRFHFLKQILPYFVRPLSLEHHERTLQPILFWPFGQIQGLPDARAGRNEMLWQTRVDHSWRDLFRSEERFLSAAAQLELLLEFNSYLLLQYPNPTVRQYAEANPEKYLNYQPDFWRSRLNPAIPMAEHIYNLLLSDAGSMAGLAVEPQLTSALFTKMTQDERMLFFGEFLEKLHRWQDNVMMQQQRFPYQFAWPRPLENAVERYLSSKKS
jgi:hypothetical protein